MDNLLRAVAHNMAFMHVSGLVSFLLTSFPCLLFLGGPESLPWTTRMKVAIGAAKGLSFLNDESQIIYRDVKTSNILLDLVL